MIDGTQIELIGEIDDAEKPAFLSGAMALLLPIDWPEPFGLVMIEAMACGTPVIAFNRGSVPEIIEHGVTGFIVEDEAAGGRGRRPVRTGCRDRHPRSASSGVSPRGAWPRTTWRCIAASPCGRARRCAWSPESSAHRAGAAVRPANRGSACVAARTEVQPYPGSRPRSPPRRCRGLLRHLQPLRTRYRLISQRREQRYRVVWE